MKALSTYYGAPASLKSTPKSTPNLTPTYLNNLAKRGRTNGTPNLSQGKMNNGLDDLDLPVLRWDRSTHHASIVGGDQRSIQSHDSERMIISKNTEWTVDFESGKDVGCSV